MFQANFNHFRHTYFWVEMGGNNPILRAIFRHIRQNFVILENLTSTLFFFVSYCQKVTPRHWMNIEGEYI